MRADGRAPDELRPVTILPDYTEMAAGSALICCGKTRVLCTASFQPGVPPFLKGQGRGWVTAEYAMLPGATPTRKARDGIKKDGRGVEISRLIGRSLRACCDLSRLGNTVTLDCDVLQADGDPHGLHHRRLRGPVPGGEQVDGKRHPAGFSRSAGSWPR